MPTVSWADHAVHVSRLVGDLYKSTQFTDCSLDTEGGLIHGHKIILAACSPYLQKLFREHHGMKIIPLKEVRYKEMKLILDVIYCGEIHVPLTDMGYLRQLAELLQISPLQCGSHNFSDTFSTKEADEGDGCNRRTNVGENFMKQPDGEKDVPVNGCLVSQVLFQDSELECNSRCQIMDQQSEGGHETKTRCNPKTLAKLMTEDQSLISSTNTIVIKTDPVNNDLGNAQYELPPFIFVGVSPVLVKSEDLGDQESENSVTDSLMKNPLETHPDDFNASKVKDIKEENDQTKIVVKQEIEASDMVFNITGNDSVIKEIKSVSDSCVVSSSNEMNHSCDEKTTNVEDDMSFANELVGDIHSNQNETTGGAVSSLFLEDCSLGKTRDIEVEFESICNPDLKEEKPYSRGMDVEYIEDDDDDESSSLKKGDEESSCVDSMQHENCGFGVTTAKELKLKKAVVVLRRIEPSYELRAGGDKSAANKICRSSIMQPVSSEVEREFKKCSGNKELFNRLHCDAFFTSNEKCKHVSSQAADKFQFRSGNKYNGDLSKKYISCQECESSFRYHCRLKRHIRFPTGKTSFKCGECDVSFSQKGHLNNHMKIHTGEKPFKCGECKASFGQSGDLKRHKRIHTGDKPFKCGMCDVPFRRKSHLSEHMRIHTGEKPFKCGVCDVSFRRRDNLNVHMRIHTGEKPFKCEVCDVSFSEKGNLNSHMRIHTGEKPFKCGECKASFGRSGVLKRHKRIHTGEKPFKCGVCDVSFSVKANLDNHMRIHTGEKPFKCVECKVSFRQCGDLMIHRRTHTGDKPFKCGICDVSFSRKDSFRIHMIRHTRDKPF